MSKNRKNPVKQTNQFPRGPKLSTARPVPLSRRQGQTSQGATSPQGLLVEGASVVLEYIRFSPKSIREIWVEPQAFGPHQLILKALGEIENSIPVHRMSREEVLAHWGVTSLQGNVAAMTKKNVLSEDEGLSALIKNHNERDLILVLDHIQDPRNLGAIIRSAAFFNVRYVFFPERRQAPLTSVVASTAQGGLAFTQLTRVTNLSRLIRELKKQGFWIIGADMAGQVVGSSIRRLDKIALVLGSEGEGLSHQIKQHCDVLVGVPSLSGLESLNVSVAAGILLSQLATNEPRQT